jgi:Flp pilus assembly protein TadB
MDEEDVGGAGSSPGAGEGPSAPDELRQMIDAGASSPEELRALAERLRLQRELEQSQWRREVRPELMRSKRKRPSLRDLRGDGPVLDPGEPPASAGPEVRWLGLGAIVVALVLFGAAAQSTVWLVLLPVLGVLGYAWWYGRQQTGGADPPG